MKGSMRQRGSAWELRVYLGADPVTGKQRYATKTVRAGKREAQRLLNEMKVEAERGLATRTTATVGELLDRWLELAREDFSPKTTRETAGYIERNLRPALGDVRLSKLTTASLDRARPVGACGRGVTPENHEPGHRLPWLGAFRNRDRGGA